MAIAADIISSKFMTYEDYLNEGEVNERYNIIDGIRTFMTSPTWRHQHTLKNIVRLLGNYEDATNSGQAAFAPLDVLITRQPLRIRHPDALFVSNEQLASGGGAPEFGPLTVAPELVIEILSSTDTRRVLDEKLSDYRAIGIRECWVISTQAETIEILSLSSESANSVATYTISQTLQSIALPGLTIAVTEIFKH